jgi:membrane associated rhomboid family serine protease
MFLPYGTDAPIYHWPKATVGLIVANVLAFAATAGMSPDDLERFALVHGQGLHPFQWVTSLFVHGNVEHLIGNMIFLWAFGIVVEGKVGALGFLAVYLGIGAAESAVEQMAFLRADEGLSYGASAAVYGLLAVCLVWAPMNELNCLWFFWRFSAQQVDIAILWFGLMYIGLQALIVAATGASRTSALYHSGGALVGLVVGTALLKSGLVDCEEWDLFAVMSGRQGRSRSGPVKGKKTVKPRDAEPAASNRPKAEARPKQSEPDSLIDAAEAANRRLRRHLDDGDAAGAHAAYDRALRTVAGWQPAGPEWVELIKALLDAGEWRSAVGVMEDYVRRDPDPSPRVRLKLAQVLLRDAGRPAHALRVLAQIPAGSLGPSLEPQRQALAVRAEKMREEGVLELDGDSW